jgi:hypothetical protein
MKLNDDIKIFDKVRFVSGPFAEAAQTEGVVIDIDPEAITYPYVVRTEQPGIAGLLEPKELETPCTAGEIEKI